MSSSADWSNDLIDARAALRRAEDFLAAGDTEHGAGALRDAIDALIKAWDTIREADDA